MENLRNDYIELAILIAIQLKPTGKIIDGFTDDFILKPLAGALESAYNILPFELDIEGIASGEIFISERIRNELDELYELYKKS